MLILILATYEEASGALAKLDKRRPIVAPGKYQDSSMVIIEKEKLRNKVTGNFEVMEFLLIVLFWFQNSLTTNRGKNKVITKIPNVLKGYKYFSTLINQGTQKPKIPKVIWNRRRNFGKSCSSGWGKTRICI